MHLTAKRFVLFSLIILTIGAATVGVAFLLGVDPLDGLAGGPSTNSDIESLFLGGGLVVALGGLALTVIGLIVVFVKLFIAKKLKALVVSLVLFVLLFAVLPVRFTYIPDNSYKCSEMDCYPEYDVSKSANSKAASYPMALAVIEKSREVQAYDIKLTEVYRNAAVAAVTAFAAYILIKKRQFVKK